MSILMLTACSTLGTKQTVNGPHSDACIWDKPLSYAIPPRDATGARPEVDPNNKYDSPETRKEIDSHNAAWRAICETHNGAASALESSNGTAFG